MHTQVAGGSDTASLTDLLADNSPAETPALTNEHAPRSLRLSQDLTPAPGMGFALRLPETLDVFDPPNDGSAAPTAHGTKQVLVGELCSLRIRQLHLTHTTHPLSPFSLSLSLSRTPLGVEPTSTAHRSLPSRFEGTGLASYGG